MQPIDLARLVKSLSENTSGKTPESSSVESQRQAIGLLLKQTLKSLASDGLLSIDTQKALISAKNILPGEFTQMFIQERLLQHKLAEQLAAQVIKAAPLTQSTVNQWFSGQLIQAIVLQAPKNGLATFLVNPQGQFDPALLVGIIQSKPDSKLSDTLMRQSQQVRIKTDLSLQAGQQLLLEVIKTRRNFSFKLNSEPAQSQQVSRHLNLLVNKQQALVNILSSLNEINQQKASAQKIFTPQFIQQVNRFIEQIPRFSQLDNSKALQQAVRDSGLFLENALAKEARAGTTGSGVTAASYGSNTAADFKAGLLQLQNMLQNGEALVLPKNVSAYGKAYNTMLQSQLQELQNQLQRFFELPAKVSHAQVQKPVKAELNLFLLNNPLVIQAHILDKLDGALARIVSTQLQSRESSDQAFYNFEIPFRHNNQTEVLQLKVREQFKQKEQQKGNKIWTVNLAFHLESLGGIRIYLTLDKLDLSIQVWSEEQHAQQIFQQNFYQLKERLSDAGFNITQLKAFHGIPEQARKEYRDSPFIIDEQV